MEDRLSFDPRELQGSDDDASGDESDASYDTTSDDYSDNDDHVSIGRATVSTQDSYHLWYRE
jgi:hypothetical protein